MDHVDHALVLCSVHAPSHHNVLLNPFEDGAIGDGMIYKWGSRSNGHDFLIYIYIYIYIYIERERERERERKWKMNLIITIPQPMSIKCK